MKELIAAESLTPFIARPGARKLGWHLRRQGHDVARCTVEPLTRYMGMHGVRRWRFVVTTRVHPPAAWSADRVDRDFATTAPNQLRVADFT